MVPARRPSPPRFTPPPPTPSPLVQLQSPIHVEWVLRLCTAGALHASEVGRDRQRRGALSGREGLFMYSLLLRLPDVLIHLPSLPSAWCRAVSWRCVRGRGGRARPAPRRSRDTAEAPLSPPRTRCLPHRRTAHSGYHRLLLTGPRRRTVIALLFPHPTPPLRVLFLDNALDPLMCGTAPPSRLTPLPLRALACPFSSDGLRGGVTPPAHVRRWAPELHQQRPTLTPTLCATAVRQ